jgi:hypothetical protein
MLVPHLDLSLGQVAWAINLGRPPAKPMLNQLNYLRQLGIPMAVTGRGAGRGNRVRYGFYDLIEAGLALYAVQHGLKPVDLKKLFIDQREAMREDYRQALKSQPESRLQEPWVKQRGIAGPVFADERWLRLHDRYADKPGTYDFVGLEALQSDSGLQPFDLAETYPGEAPRGLVPLTRLMLRWIAWALEAPEVKTGPKT